MENMLLDGGIVAGAIVLLAWLLNQGLAMIGVDLAVDQKKGIVLAASVALALGIDPFNLGSPSLNPDYLAFLAGEAGIVFKAAQLIYDQVFQRLLQA